MSPGAKPCPPSVSALLLADPSPSLRVTVLRALLGRPSSDPEVRELEALRREDPVVAPVLRGEEDGVLYPGMSRSVALSLTLLRLSRAGYGRSHPAVRRRAESLFSLQREDGSWPMPTARERAEREDGPRAGRTRGYDTIPLQTAIPLRGLCTSGYAVDPRCERAFQWLLARRLEDGSWPTGMSGGVRGRVAGYRRLPHSRWGCRSNTTGALLCLALHPARRTSAQARTALDHLLSTQTWDMAELGFDLARILGFERARGFITHYAAADPAMLLELCARVGIGTADERVRALRDAVCARRGELGLWEHPRHPEASRWLTLDLLRSLSLLEKGTDWLEGAIRTPFQPYPRPQRRH